MFHFVVSVAEDAGRQCTAGSAVRVELRSQNASGKRQTTTNQLHTKMGAESYLLDALIQLPEANSYS